VKSRCFWIMTYVGETDFRSMEAPARRVFSRDPVADPSTETVENLVETSRDALLNR
jgi:hypothetical protein